MVATPSVCMIKQQKWPSLSWFAKALVYVIEFHLVTHLQFTTIINQYDSTVDTAPSIDGRLHNSAPLAPAPAYSKSPWLILFFFFSVIIRLCELRIPFHERIKHELRLVNSRLLYLLLCGQHGNPISTAEGSGSVSPTSSLVPKSFEVRYQGTSTAKSNDNKIQTAATASPQLVPTIHSPSQCSLIITNAPTAPEPQTVLWVFQAKDWECTVCCRSGPVP